MEMIVYTNITSGDLMAQYGDWRYIEAKRVHLEEDATAPDFKILYAGPVVKRDWKTFWYCFTRKRVYLPKFFPENP